jgi:3-methyladenine DNA glycosylase AlkD
VVAAGRAGLDGAAESPVQGRDRPTERTLDICRRLAADGDDMVVKALSWALRELVVWDPEAVRRFLDAQHPARRAT